MANNKKRLKTEVPTTQDGQVGIRATLNNMGISNSAIGYNDNEKTVTINGKNFMKPDYLDEDAGISYATDKNIQKSLVDFYKNSSNPIVRVSDAYSSIAGQYGLSADGLTYGNDTVSIGGIPLDILYIDNENKAWAWNKDVLNAVENYANTAEVTSPVNLAEEYAKKYLNNVWDLANNIQERKDFSYNPDNDPVYKAYKNKYQLESDRATKNAMASYSSLTGGYTNSSAVTAGAQAAQYYSQQLANTIPELAEKAYNRYMEKYQTDLNLLDKIISIYDKSYDNSLAANKQQVDNVNSVASSNIQRDNSAYNRNRQAWRDAWTEKFNQQDYSNNERNTSRQEVDWYWEDTFNAMDLTKMGYENEGLKLNNQQKELYQKYYQQLLEAELEGMTVENKLKYRDLYLGY